MVEAGGLIVGTGKIHFPLKMIYQTERETKTMLSDQRRRRALGIQPPRLPELAIHLLLAKVLHDPRTIKRQTVIVPKG